MQAALYTTATTTVAHERLCAAYRRTTDAAVAPEPYVRVWFFQSRACIERKPRLPHHRHRVLLAATSARQGRRRAYLEALASPERKSPAKRPRTPSSWRPWSRLDDHCARRCWSAITQETFPVAQLGGLDCAEDHSTPEHRLLGRSGARYVSGLATLLRPSAEPPLSAPQLTDRPTSLAGSGRRMEHVLRHCTSLKSTVIRDKRLSQGWGLALSRALINPAVATNSTTLNPAGPCDRHCQQPGTRLKGSNGARYADHEQPQLTTP